MDAELLELQRQLEDAQKSKSSVRLSERNVVELVHKLQEQGIIEFDLLHTVSGKEYITSDQLKLEIEAEIKKLGRVSLVDLSDILGVDLYHVERHSQKIVEDNPSLVIINGDIISQLYWDSVAEEINDKLQEHSQIALAEIAAQLHIGSELVVSVLEPRLGTIIKGRLEGGQLYTPDYVSRITAMVRGATRGITVPTSLPSVWNTLQQLLQDVDGATGVSVEGFFFQSIFNALVREGELLGSLRAGIHWTPEVFAHAQKESVDSFFSQNSYISYSVLQKLVIPQPKQYLQARYPEGIPLEDVFVHPSIVDLLDSALADAIDRGSWIDGLSVLPEFISGPDASKIFSLCPSMQRAIKSSSAVLLGESCVFSNAFIKEIFDRLEKEMETQIVSQSMFADDQVSNEAKKGSTSHNSELKDYGEEENSSSVQERGGSKKKRGKVATSGKAATSVTDEDFQDNLPSKIKKNQRKNKDVNSSTVSDTKVGAKKGLDKTKDLNAFPEEWIEQRILTCFPDLDELAGSETLRLLCSHVRPMLLNAWKQRRNIILSENSERRRRLLDDLQKQLDELILGLQLHEKALETFEDDSATTVLLNKHLLKTMGSSIVDKLLVTLDMDNKLKNGLEIEDYQNQQFALSTADRTSLAKSLPWSMSDKAQKLAEALEGKRVDTFISALSAVLEESGLLLKKLDKRLERTMLHSYRKDLVSQVSSENDPVLLLPKVVALLFFQVHNKALQAPGRTIGAIISLLKDKVPHSTYKILMDYHNATVKLLALQAAATGDEDDCSADRILTQKEQLEGMMPELKALALGTAST